MSLTAMDHEAIRATLVAYSHAIDFGRGDLLAALFIAGGSFEIPGLPADSPLAGPISGNEGFDRLAATVWAGAKGNMRHWVQPPLIEELSEGRVKATSYVAVIRTGITPSAGILITGLYRDELHRQGDRWLIARREFHADPQPGQEGPGDDPLIAMRDDFVAAHAPRSG